ncbi:unnamed protein product, partial [Lymnaea stagnalis]
VSLCYIVHVNSLFRLVVERHSVCSLCRSFTQSSLSLYRILFTMGRPKGSLGKNSKKKVKDANKPKRATSAYFYFLAQCRKEAAKAGKAPTKIAEFTKEASEKWRSLTTDKKKPFEAAAADDKKRYEQEMAAYKGKTVDPNKPKRPPTAYFLFLADFRIRMANKGIEHKELLKMAGEEWRALSNEDKKPYEKRALEESKKYESAMTDYRKVS